MDQYRIDLHPVTDGGYLFENWFAPKLPKNYYQFKEEVVYDESDQQTHKYQFIQNEGVKDIFVENQTVLFSFTVDRDEPYLVDNKLKINWGVFENE